MARWYSLETALERRWKREENFGYWGSSLPLFLRSLAFPDGLMPMGG